MGQGNNTSMSEENVVGNVYIYCRFCKVDIVENKVEWREIAKETKQVEKSNDYSFLRGLSP